MASQNEGYWARSKALVMRDKGWYKPLLVLSAVNLVPIVGQFGASGYALEWGRLTAWGVDSAPKQKNVDVGGCIKSGARAFVVSLGYGLILALVRLLINKLLGDMLSPIISLPLTLAVGMIVLVATLRATIYQSIGAGYQIERIADMVKRDYQGLLRILGLTVVMGLVVGVAFGVLLSGVMVANIGTIMDDIIAMERYGYNDDWYVVSTVLRWVGSMLPAMFVVAYIAGVATSFANLIQTTAVALWMRQFDVARWGESSDPLPTAGPADGQAAGANPVQPSAEPQDAWSDLGGAPSSSVPYDVQRMNEQIWAGQAQQPIPQPVEPEQPTSDVPLFAIPQEPSVPSVVSVAEEPEAKMGSVPTPAPEPTPADDRHVDVAAVQEEAEQLVDYLPWEPKPEPVAPQPEAPAESAASTTSDVKTFSLADAVAQSREIVNEPLPYAAYPGTVKKTIDTAPQAHTVPFYEEDAAVDVDDQPEETFDEAPHDERVESGGRIVDVHELTSFAQVDDPEPEPEQQPEANQGEKSEPEDDNQ